MKKTLFIYLIFILLLKTFSFAESLTGAGATFPNLLYQLMFSEYNELTKDTISYKSIGSGQGIKRLLKKEIDFAATDIPQKSLGKDIKENFIFIPTTFSAISIVYNLPNVPLLKLTPKLISAIFRGEITFWDDKKIQEINDQVQLPHIKINPLTRSKESGSTYLFTHFLSKHVLKWKFTIGSGAKVDFNYGKSLDDNNKILEEIKHTEGTISYTEWHYAEENDLQRAAVQNKKGNFVFANINSLLESVEMSSLKNDYNLLNSKNPYAYPICGFSWIVVPKVLDGTHTYEESKSLINLLTWMVKHGQLLAEENNFPPLPNYASKMALDQIRKVKFSDVILN